MGAASPCSWLCRFFLWHAEGRLGGSRVAAARLTRGGKSTDVQHARICSARLQCTLLEVLRSNECCSAARRANVDKALLVNKAETENSQTDTSSREGRDLF